MEDGKEGEWRRMEDMNVEGRRIEVKKLNGKNVRQERRREKNGRKGRGEGKERKMKQKREMRKKRMKDNDILWYEVVFFCKRERKLVEESGNEKNEGRKKIEFPRV